VNRFEFLPFLEYYEAMRSLHRTTYSGRFGFSLVELSIVLVILGLLSGGILGGQSLIRAAELRALNTEYQRYATAAQTFRDKYFALPGDMAEATKFWGRQVNAAHCVTNSGQAVNSATGVCDGNGNGQIMIGAAGAESSEAFQYWRQLAAAGLIEGSYTGLAESNNRYHASAANLPRSRFPQAFWSVQYNGFLDGTATTDFTGQYDNYYTVGSLMTNNYNWSAFLTPEEMWNIDTKSDDGKPGTGRIVAHSRDQCANATSATDYAATYRLDVKSVVCKFYVMRL
jgi:prepilin-type N-terminal cleavage/methylation domain-containing protein